MGFQKSSEHELRFILYALAKNAGGPNFPGGGPRGCPRGTQAHQKPPDSSAPRTGLNCRTHLQSWANAGGSGTRPGMGSSPWEPVNREMRESTLLVLLPAPRPHPVRNLPSQQQPALNLGSPSKLGIFSASGLSARGSAPSQQRWSLPALRGYFPSSL